MCVSDVDHSVVFDYYYYNALHALDWRPVQFSHKKVIYIQNGQVVHRLVNGIGYMYLYYVVFVKLQYTLCTTILIIIMIITHIFDLTNL